MGALADARFRRLLAGNSLSSFGDSALYLSLGIWAKDLTGSNAAAGAIFLAQGLGALSAPFAGHLADRVPRRRLLVVTNAATALVVLSLLGVRSEAQFWVMYLVAVAYGAAFGVLAAGGAGLVKDMLADEDLASANAASTTISQGLRIASPLAGAALFAAFGGGAVAILDSATFLAAIAALLTVHVAEAPLLAGRDVPVRVQLLAGAAHIRRSPGLSQILMAAVVAMLVLGFYEPLTFAVIAALHRRPPFFGVLMSVQAVGSIAGGLVSPRLVRRFGEARVLGTALVAWAAASLIYAVPVVAAACGALAVFGIAVSFYAVALATATQRGTPPSLQGRVNAATSMATNLAQTLSIATGAVLVGLLGYRPLLFAVAAVVVVAALPLLVNPAARVGPPVPRLLGQTGPPA